MVVPFHTSFRRAVAPPATELPALPDFAPVFKNIMTVDGSKRVQVYNALVDMLQAYARAAIAADRAACPVLTDEQIKALFDETKWPSEQFTIRVLSFARAVLAAATQGSKHG